MSEQLDHDPGAPCEQAWRRKLNSSADFLTEFRVTFMEAVKMVITLMFKTVGCVKAIGWISVEFVCVF